MKRCQVLKQGNLWWSRRDGSETSYGEFSTPRLRDPGDGTSVWAHNKASVPCWAWRLQWHGEGVGRGALRRATAGLQCHSLHVEVSENQCQDQVWKSKRRSAWCSYPKRFKKKVISSYWATIQMYLGNIERWFHMLPFPSLFPINSYERKEVTAAPFNDGHQWRKYGEKTIAGCIFPRFVASIIQIIYPITETCGNHSIKPVKSN